jgi:hypothetical protein
MGTVTVNVNTLTSCFYQPQTVAKYIKDCCGDNQIDASDLKTLNKHLGGLRVYISFNRSPDGNGAIDEKERRTMTICEIWKHASGIKIKSNGKSAETNVLDYLKKKYSDATNSAIRTTHGAIAVNVGAKHPNEKYYLANQLTVMSDQMYRKKLTSAQTDSMIDIARRSPPENRDYILKEGLRSLQLDETANRQPAIFEKFNISVSAEMLSLPARRADRPTVQYGPSDPTQSQQPSLVPEAEVDNARWNNKGQKFVDIRNRFRPTGPALVAFMCVGEGHQEQMTNRQKYAADFIRTQNSVQTLSWYKKETEDQFTLLEGGILLLGTSPIWATLYAASKTKESISLCSCCQRRMRSTPVATPRSKPLRTRW